jgi:competence ComEA-like helix-hairpin-helix protein
MKKLALLVFAFVFLLVPAAYAAGVVNINTADASLLETLPGIGPSKAAAIISYRTQHGPFAAIADIQDVSGIGPSTYSQIENSISVEGESTASVPATQSMLSASSPTTGTSRDSIIPADEPAVHVDAGGDRSIIAGADTAYAVSATDKDGAPYQEMQAHWTWGDGSSSTGANVFKSYPLPGTYLVGVSVTSGMGSGSAQFQVKVSDAQVAISAISPAGITVRNLDTANALDLSRWQLSSGASLFTLPPGTQIVASGSVTFTPEITGLAGATEASLLYPSGKVAATYSAVAQPSAPIASSHQGNNVIAPAHVVEPVGAPAPSTQVAAAGAALAAMSEASSAPAKSVAKNRLAAALTSPWTLGFGGLLVFSAGAFILL